jgi:hypothetical protein
MIRLNDINKTVIDETKVVAYDRFVDNYYDSKAGISKNMEVISLFVERHYIKVWYESKEARDNDIELLDKLFEVKNIKEQVEIEKLKKEVASHDMGITSELASEYISNLNTCAPTKEEYITWDYVVEYNIPLKAKLPNGDIRTLRYEDNFDGLIGICTRDDNENYSACFYDKETFNSLKLRKVE